MLEIIRAWKNAHQSNETFTRCPNCNGPLKRMKGAFYWDGRHYDGATCCNGLWAIVGEEMPSLRPTAERVGS